MRYKSGCSVKTGPSGRFSAGFKFVAHFGQIIVAVAVNYIGTNGSAIKLHVVRRGGSFPVTF